MGYFRQEPILDESKNVMENVLDGVSNLMRWVIPWQTLLWQVRDKLEILDRHRELSDQISNNSIAEGNLEEVGGMASWRPVLIHTQAVKERDELAQQIADGGFKNLENKIARAMQALRCPPPESDVINLSGVMQRLDRLFFDIF